jgi:hypothetical protein
LTGAFNAAWEIGAEEKISALITKTARATLRITQFNSKSFSVKSFAGAQVSEIEFGISQSYRLWL